MINNVLGDIMSLSPVRLTDEALLQWSVEQGFGIFFRSSSVDPVQTLHEMRDFYTTLQKRVSDYFDSIAEFS